MNALVEAMLTIAPRRAGDWRSPNRFDTCRSVLGSHFVPHLVFLTERSVPK
jgi:hypothetical protein